MKTRSRDAMIQGNNPNVVFNNIYFTRRKKKNKVFVLVEGDGDIGFYKNIINKDYVSFIPMGEKRGNKRVSAKENLIATIELLNNEKIKGVVAIADNDYDEIVGNKRKMDNLVYTDDHDMETMILKTDAYNKFENEYGDLDGIDTYKNEKGPILDCVLNCGSKIGKIRLLSIRHDLKLDFKPVELEKYFNASLEFDWKKYFKQVLYVSDKLEQKEILFENVENDNRDYDIWQLCRGHDLTELIVVFYSKESKYKIGNSKAKGLKPERVESFLRGAYYAPVHFKKTQMLKQLQKWQLSNVEWKLLNSDFSVS